MPYTRKKGTDTVYAMLTGQDPWPRGRRREFLLRSPRAGAETAEDGTTVTLRGNLLGKGDAETVDVGFEYRK